jgi:hypothetical protein
VRAADPPLFRAAVGHPPPRRGRSRPSGRRGRSVRCGPPRCPRR